MLARFCYDFQDMEEERDLRNGLESEKGLLEVCFGTAMSGWFGQRDPYLGVRYGVTR